MDHVQATRAIALSTVALLLGALDVASGWARPDWALALAGALPVALLGLFVLLEPGSARVA